MPNLIAAELRQLIEENKQYAGMIMRFQHVQQFLALLVAEESRESALGTTAAEWYGLGWVQGFENGRKGH